MKFVMLTGGLGNQLFIYAFCCELRKRGYPTVLYKPYSKNAKSYGHQGYELKKIFNIREFDGFLSIIITYLLYLFTWLIKVLPNKNRTKLYNLVGVKVVKTDNFIYYPQVFTCKNRHELFIGTWQSEKYFSSSKMEIKKSLVFIEQLLNTESKAMKSKIKHCNSVSIHIRRGDYLNDKYSAGFAEVCNKDYYNCALGYLKKKFQNLQFFIFTDDWDYVRDNFKIENSTFVDFNKSKDSWQDMFLMSCCKHNIIANSTFSWWGAWLNSNPKKIVIAPVVWWKQIKDDDVVPESWIRL